MKAQLIRMVGGAVRLMLEPQSEEERAYLGRDLRSLVPVVRRSVDDDGREGQLLSVTLTDERHPRCVTCGSLDVYPYDETGDLCCENGCAAVASHHVEQVCE